MIGKQNNFICDQKAETWWKPITAPKKMVSHTADQPASFSRAKSRSTVKGSGFSRTKANGSRLIHPGIPDTNTHTSLSFVKEEGARSQQCELVSIGFSGVEIEGMTLIYLYSWAGSPLLPLTRSLGRWTVWWLQHTGQEWGIWFRPSFIPQVFSDYLLYSRHCARH